MSKIFDLTLIYATIRSATPILFAALCCTITQQADILNIGTEGIMLTSAFVAVEAGLPGSLSDSLAGARLLHWNLAGDGQTS